MDDQEILYDRIRHFPLFEGFDRADVLFLLSYLDARLEVFEKGGVIALLSGVVKSFALILSGSLELAQYDYWGNRSLILTHEAGGCVGLPSTLFENWRSPADLAARGRCELLFFDAKKLRVPEAPPVPACTLLRSNIARQLALNNFALINKISLINRRSTREKVALFLSKKAAACGSSRFTIEFSRQEMADFLSVDRCALSKELSRMQRDGLIEFDHRHFELKSLQEADHCPAK